ncbi:MAG: hypothetical protein PWQ37_766 [Candidatus Petromonas sp.]|jgi:murein DD-endopeptidase MepM/ murein hydrolase activator NlpD|nr:hypothetical protein [Candidatus Petromonas sp.]
MNKSYRRNIINRQKQKSYNYRKQSSFIRNKRPVSFYKKLLKQILISILIVLLVIFLKSINTPLTKETSALMKKVIYTEFDYKESFNKILEYASDIKDYSKKAIPVFKSNDNEINFAFPLEGMIISTYGQKYNPMTEKYSFQKGIDIQMTGSKIVKSVEDGIIEKIGESENFGKYIKVRHSSKMFTLYSKIDKIYVKKNQKVLKGERLGEIKDKENSILHFELWINDETVDPQMYLGYDKINI